MAISSLAALPVLFPRGFLRAWMEFSLAHVAVVVVECFSQKTPKNRALVT